MRSLQSLPYSMHRRRAILCTAISKRTMKRAHKTLRAKVRKIIKPAYPTQPEKAEISIEEADDLYREIRIENHNWQAMKSPTSHPRKTVLIVDDNPWIRMVLRERFQREADLAVCG